MKITKTFHAKSIQDWHAWLVENHQREKEVWLIFYKKNCGIATISYDDAIDEALCFGWIDSIIQKIDEEKYTRKFTPRRDTKKWSVANIKRVNRLIESKRMNPTGLTKLGNMHLLKEKVNPGKAEPFCIPDEIEQVIRKNEKAWSNYQNLPPSTRRRYFTWVLNAKKAETLQKRLLEVIDVLEKNIPLGLK